MLFTNKIFAVEDANISGLLLDPATNPAPKLAGIKTLGGLLTGGGFNVLDLIFVFVGLAFFVNLIMAGWDYLLSSGDPKKIAGATTRITNGIIGLIMAISAFLVVRIITNLIGIPGIFIGTSNSGR